MKPTAEDVAATVAEIRSYSARMHQDGEFLFMHKQVIDAWADELEAADARCRALEGAVAALTGALNGEPLEVESDD